MRWGSAANDPSDEAEREQGVKVTSFQLAKPLLAKAMSDVMIAVQHVFKSVTDSTGTLTILRDIDFSLQAGETAAIVGASGSGKSTLLSIIAGLDTPSQGTVQIGGVDLYQRTEDERAALRAEKVGFVFQSFQLLANLTALENVMLPLELAGRSDARAAATPDAAARGPGRAAQQLPQGAVWWRAATGGAGPGLCGAPGRVAGR